MRARATLALTATAVLAAPATLAAPRSRATSDGSLQLRHSEPSLVAPTAEEGLAWTPPAGWMPVSARLTALGQPVHRLAAATFDLRQRRPDRDCSPDTARSQLPADGALVFLLEDREAAARPKALARFPRRPVHFRLDTPEPHECFGLASVVRWTEQGRAFTAVAMFGERASRRREAEALLDSLVVQAIPPPPPPAGWRSVVSGAYDSMRVPPDWTAHALQHPHTTKRPRRLFRLANRNGTVVVRVSERRRGPASPAFPPATDPLAFDADRRAGLSFRGFRFSIRIFARAGAPARDIAWAETSARTLGVSGAGRG